MTDRLHLTHLDACRTAFDGTSEACARILFLGEDNPLSQEPEHALFPYPEGCSGWRFCHKILGVRRATYLATWRTNLCVGKWSAPKARTRALQLVAPECPWRIVVMLGRKVTDAVVGALDHDAELWPFQADYFDVGGAEFTLISLPHPSGRNKIWNDHRAPTNVRMLLQEIIPEYPCGEA
jgi:hypothetical protein